MKTSHTGSNIRKKELGAFYTHKGLTDVISEWAIRSADCRVFEPSFGGCGFLRSAHDRLTAIKGSPAIDQIYGCDIDPEAFGFLANLFERPVDLERFQEGDFLHQDFPDSWLSSFDAVIGNPPYLPYRKISPQARDVALRHLRRDGLELDRRSSLWAYFVGLSVRFIKQGGRMAWVLPSSFLYANYSIALRKFIAGYFSRVCAFELQERQFLLEGTEEKTIVVLAEGKRASFSGSLAGDIDLIRCDGSRDLSEKISGWEKDAHFKAASCGTAVIDCLSDAPLQLFERLKASGCHHDLGHFIRVQIGLVTGNNRFFLRTEEERQEAGIHEKDLVRVLPRFTYVGGADLTAIDVQSMQDVGAKVFLVSAASEANASRQVQDYLATYPEEEKAACSTFRKRSSWSATDDGAIPDAFFPVMQHNGPRLVLNSAKLNCTNSIHRGYFIKTLSQSKKKLIALSTLSTFSQISAEIAGRYYGSGALKHEPREAEAMGVLLPQLHHGKIAAAFRRADRFLRAGNFDEASQVADQVILEAIGIESVPTQAAVLRSGLAQLRKNRQR
jgi:adenine-specific DNA methylase